MYVRIRNNQLNAAQRKALKAECVKEFNNLLAEYNREAALQILYILRFEYGFGQERLNRFADRLSEMQNRMVDRYDAEDKEIPDICEIKLRESGINVDELLKEG